MHRSVLAGVFTGLWLLVAVACGEPARGLNAADADIPGLLVVARDTDDDDRGGLYLVAADGSAARPIGDNDGHGEVVMSPDGRTVAAVRADEDDQPVVLIDVESGEVRPVAAPRGSYFGVSWSPDNSMIVFTGFDYSRTATGGSGDQPGVLRDLIYLADADGSNVRAIPESDGAMSPTWSADGRWLAYVQDSAIWLANADGSDPHAVTTGMQSIFNPVWSPASDRIAFTGYENEYPAIFVVNADGTGQAKLSPDGQFADKPAWSPDGNWLAYSVFDDGDITLHRIRPDGSEHRVIAEVERINRLAWSPDGSWIAFTSAYGGNDGPITSIHLNVVHAFEPDAKVHTLLRDLASWDSLTWHDGELPELPVGDRSSSP